MKIDSIAANVIFFLSIIVFFYLNNFLFLFFLLPISIYYFIFYKEEFYFSLVFFGQSFIVFFARLLPITASQVLVLFTFLLFLELLKHKQISIKSNVLVYILGFLLLIALMSIQLIRSEYFDYGTYKYIYFFSYSICYLIIGIYLRNKKINENHVLPISLLFFLFFFINSQNSILQFISKIAELSFGLRSIPEVKDMAISLARIGGLGIILCFYMITEKKSFVGAIAGLIPFISIVILYQTRQAILAAFLSIILIILISTTIKAQNKMAFFIVLLSLGAFLILNLENIIQNQDMFSRITNLNLSGREIFYQKALGFITSNPIEGIGLGSYGDHIYPHNIVLEFWTELGILGLLFISIYLLGISFQIILSLYFRNSYNNLAIGFLIFCLLVALISRDIARNALLIIFPLLIIQTKIPEVKE